MLPEHAAKLRNRIQNFFPWPRDLVMIEDVGNVCKVVMGWPKGRMIRMVKMKQAAAAAAKYGRPSEEYGKDGYRVVVPWRAVRM